IVRGAAAPSSQSTARPLSISTPSGQSLRTARRGAGKPIQGKCPRAGLLERCPEDLVASTRRWDSQAELRPLARSAVHETQQRRQVVSEDFYINSARVRFEQIDAEIAAAQADLAAHRRNSDFDSGAYAEQQIADLKAQRRNMVALYNEHVASQ